MRFGLLASVACALSVVLVVAVPAEASLIGDTVGCNVTGGGTFECSQPTATVVDPGVEFQVGVPVLNPDYIGVDFGSNDVLLTFPQGSALGSTILNLNDLTNAFTSASLLSDPGFSGFSDANVTLNSGLLLVDLRNVDGAVGASIDIALTTATTAVPEPASLAILSSALVGFVPIRRRRKAA